MNSFAELTPLLKSLRLSGILDSIEVRNRQAIDERLAYSEFLTLLIQDECARRDQKKLTMRLRRAAFHTSKTIEQFDFNALPTLNRSVIQDLLTCRFVAECAAILIAGPTGTGKSHLAQSIGHQAVRLGHDVLFMTQSQLLGALARARLAGTFDRRMQALARAPLMIVDDFGLKPLRSAADEDFHELIAARYERGATIVTSNLDFTEWADAFPDNKLLGAATLDRLLHNAYRLILEGPSFRKPRALIGAENVIANSKPPTSTKNKR